jgi:hypothetical protein
MQLRDSYRVLKSSDSGAPQYAKAEVSGFFTFGSEKPSSAETQTVHFHFSSEARDNSNTPSVWLYGAKFFRSFVAPYTDDIKLYAKGKIATSHESSGDDGNFVVPALRSLISAAKIEGCEVELDGEVPNIVVNDMLTNESADFRAKLKTLAIASSTFIRFGGMNNGFVVSSLERTGNTDIFQIPTDCLTLQNNIYSFSMQTPMKDQVYSGLEISWGKNIATGKYEHVLLVDEFGDVWHDGERKRDANNYYQPKGNSETWSAIFERLGYNVGHGINNLKSIENEWIRDWEGAERAAQTYLSWCCAPLRKAQIKCVKPLMDEEAKKKGKEVNIGKFVSLDLPGYPEKMAKTTWIVTSMTEDLDSFVTTIGLLEAWNIEAPTEKYLLKEEDGDYINTEEEHHIKLEDRWQTD